MATLATLSVLLLSGASLLHAATLEIFSNGEKPVLAKPLSAEDAAALKLDLPRDGSATVSVRLSVPGQGKLAALSKPRLRIKSGGESTAALRSYVVGVHLFSKSSFKHGASGEVPDILIPNELASQSGFKIPAANIPSRPIFAFDIRAGEKAKPGAYEAEITFEARGEKYELPLKIKIYSTLLPKQFRLRTSFGFAPWTVLRKHYGAWNAEELKLYRRYFELASDHRLDMHKIYLSLPENPEGGDLLMAGAKGQSFLELWHSVQSGDIGDTGYRWATTDLPVPETMKYPATLAPAQREKIKKYWQALSLSVARHDLQNSTFVYFVDEPKPETFSRIAPSLKLIREWAPDLQFLGTVHHTAKLEGTFNLWCVNLYQWDVAGFPRPDFYARRQSEKGEKLWFYVSCNSHGCDGPDDVQLPDLVIDRASAYHRVLPWEALRYQATGILHYDTVYGYEKPDSPWKDNFEFTGYGEGNLFYPCTPALCGTDGHEALPSLRLKSLRDGLEDAEILAMARSKGLPVDAWIKELIPSVRKFPTDTAAYEKIKVRALEGLEAK